MHAIGVTAYGAPDQLQVLDVPPEPLGPGDVRVRVNAAAVSLVDVGVRMGLFDDQAVPAPPGAVPGMDASGEVVEVGDDVDTGLAVGDHVMAAVLPVGSHGAYREDLVLPAHSVVKVPEGASDVEASTLPMNGLAAHFALASLELEAGQTLAVTGAAGTLGGYVVELAKRRGLRVVADSSVADRALVEGLGADLVLPRGDRFAAHGLQHHPHGVDGVVDAAVLGESVIGLVKNGGALATVRGWDGGDQRRVTVVPLRVEQHLHERDVLDDLRALVETGLLSLRVAGALPATMAAEAHRRLEAGGVRGRIVLTF